MRDLVRVINQITKEIPYTEHAFLDQLADVLSDIRYTAPELIGDRWNDAQEVIMRNINVHNIYDGNKYNKEWELRVLEIFTEKDRKELL
jgi:hypothetical protein